MLPSPHPCSNPKSPQTITPVRKPNKTLIVAVIGWTIIGLAIVGGAGFFAGLKYEQGQNSAKKAAVQDALKAAQPVAQAPLK